MPSITSRFLHCKLGEVALQANKPEEAQQSYERCERFWEQDLKEHMEDPFSKGLAQRKLGEIATRLGDVALRQGNLERAQAEYERSLKTLSQLASDQPNADSGLAQLALMEGSAPNLIGLGGVAQKREQKTQARDYYQRALEMRTKLAETNPSSERAQKDLADSLELALSATQLDESPAAAVANLRLAIAASIRVAAAEPLKTAAEARVLRLQLQLVALLNKGGQPAPLELEYARALLAHLRPRLSPEEAEKLDAALAAADRPESRGKHHSHRSAHHPK